MITASLWALLTKGTAFITIGTRAWICLWICPLIEGLSSNSVNYSDRIVCDNLSIITPENDDINDFTVLWKMMYAFCMNKVLGELQTRSRLDIQPVL